LTIYQSFWHLWRSGSEGGLMVIALVGGLEFEVLYKIIQQQKVQCSQKIMENIFWKIYMT